MNKDWLVGVIGFTIIVCTTVVSAFNHSVNTQNNMAKNIEAAIAKGVDPVSVKCAYDTNSSTTCITYAATQKK